VHWFGQWRQSLEILSVVICSSVWSVVSKPGICDSVVISALVSSIVPTILGFCKSSSDVELQTWVQVKRSYGQEQRANCNVKTKQTVSAELLVVRTYPLEDGLGTRSKSGTP
jgi:hypothetical protein